MHFTIEDVPDIMKLVIIAFVGKLIVPGENTMN